MRAPRFLIETMLSGRADLWLVFRRGRRRGESFKMQRFVRMMSFLGGRYVLIANVFVFLIACFTAFQMDYVRAGLRQAHLLDSWKLLVPFFVVLVVRKIVLSCIFLLIYLAISVLLFRAMPLVEVGVLRRRNIENLIYLHNGFYLFALVCLAVYLLAAAILKFWNRTKK
jgi:hypothetical protein